MTTKERFSLLETATPTSGSVQSHMSCSNSLQRLRATNSYSQSIPKEITAKETIHASEENHVDDSKLSLTCALQSVFRGRVVSLGRPLGAASVDGSYQQTRQWKSILAKFFICIWCLLSVVYSSAELYKWMKVSHKARRSTEGASGFYSLYGNDSAALHLRLTKLTAANHVIDSFEPNVLSSPDVISFPNSLDMTACLWLNDSLLETFLEWASSSQWQGPISVVFTVMTSSTSGERTAFLKKLKGLKPRHFDSPLYLHVLSLKSSGAVSPNAFLNLARLFAPTSQVLLFPGFPMTLPEGFNAMLSAYENRPMVVSEVTKFPFTPLAPALLPIDHDLWCTERQFIGLSRTADWEECLWQIVFEGQGDVGLMNISINISDAGTFTFSDVELSHRQRLRDRQRRESCGNAKRASNTNVYLEKSRKVEFYKELC